MNGIKTTLACRIAGVDRQQFNEAVSRGFYSCSIKTRAGSSRVFGALDMLPLMVFGQMLRSGSRVKRAGYLADVAYTALSGHACNFSGSDADVQVRAALDRWPLMVFEFSEGGFIRAAFFSSRCSLRDNLRLAPDCHHFMTFDAGQLLADYWAARSAAVTP